MSAPTTNESLPERIGHYEVVFSVATRPGSTFVVARDDDPAAPPVTIQRFAPAVRRSRDLEKFLDDVREALGVRHPNVARISELRNDDDELYLVMEHLDGETAASVIHRLDVEGRSLDFALAAHVAAEAAAALRAGHDMGVLHGHLTPHDVFIRYDGGVRVLDLGIAHALDAVVSAKAIDERELPYASPERCKGEPVDRRSDVFSLGAILWELTTGVSPFEGINPAETLRAILTKDPRIPPTKILRTLPAELSAIALCALARDPAERYPTVDQLESELRAFVASVPLGGEPTAPLATLMQSQFAKRIKNNARMLRRRSSAPSLPVSDEVPPSDPEPPQSNPQAIPELEQILLEKPTVEAFVPVAIPPPPPEPPPPEPEPEAEPEPEPARSPAPMAEPESRPRQRSPALLVVSIAAAVSVVAFVGSGLRSRSQPSPEGPSRPASPTSASLAPSAAPNVTTTSTGAAPAETTTIRIETTPAKATIVVGGTLTGVSPFEVKVPKSHTPVSVEARHAGYQVLRESIVPDADHRLKLTLSALQSRSTSQQTPSASAAPPTPPPTETAPPAPSSPYHRFD